MQTIEKTPIAGFGAAALDYYREPGLVSAGYTPGSKGGWTPEYDEVLPTLMNGDFERHVGGNVVNVLAYLALTGSYQANFFSVLGPASDTTSNTILEHLDARHIDTGQVLRVAGYNPSVSIIERKDGDRMVRGRPRGDMPRYLTDAFISKATANSKLVVASSLKSNDLNRRLFNLTPNGVPISFNPGGSEFEAYPDALQEIMRTRNPFLLALNETEVTQLYGGNLPKPTDARDLQAIASEACRQLAHNVLLTAGKDGFVLASRRDNDAAGNAEIETTYQPAHVVANPVDTLGAGDRGHAVTIDGLMRGISQQAIVKLVAESTAQVVMHSGAHDDLPFPQTTAA